MWSQKEPKKYHVNLPTNLLYTITSISQAPNIQHSQQSGIGQEQTHTLSGSLALAKTGYGSNLSSNPLLNPGIIRVRIAFSESPTYLIIQYYLGPECVRLLEFYCTSNDDKDASSSAFESKTGQGLKCVRFQIFLSHAPIICKDMGKDQRWDKKKQSKTNGVY